MHGGRHFRAPAPAAGEGKQEEGAITKADQAIGTGGQHRFQRIFGERGLARGPYAARGIGPTNPPHQFLDGRIARGIGDIAHLVGFGEHRESVQDAY